MSTTTSLTLNSLLGNHPQVNAIKQGRLTSPLLQFKFADIAVPNRAFKRVVRDLEFDFCELAIVTFLQARAQGIALAMLPATLVGRFQHPFIVCNAARGPLAPRDLHGRRVGVRASSQTTVAWVRGILMHEHGVDLDQVQWVSYEDAHVAHCPDPAGFTRAPDGKDLLQMLIDGEIDAGVVPEKDLGDPRLARVIPDTPAAATAWHVKYGATHVNHMAVIKAALLRERPDVVREIYRLLVEAKRMAGLPAGGIDMLPFGVEACRPSLEILIAYCVEQGLIPRAISVDELFEDVMRVLG